jgi:hypothetical protein
VYNVSIYKDNETYRLTEKYSDINAAADAHDKMAVALGRSAEYLNFPEKYDQHVFFNQLAGATGTRTNGFKVFDEDLQFLVLRFCHVVLDIYPE